MLGIFKKFKSRKHPEPSVEGRRLTIHAMVAMAAADGDVAAEEMAKIDEIYAGLTGTQLGADTIGQIAYPFLDQRVDIEEKLSDEQASLTQDEKVLIFKSAYMVLLADGLVEAGESLALEAIERGLGLSREEGAAIMKEVEAA
ncbi:MAG: TerB family tellurite resistance protein [Aquisalinus sp.]|nr:TerB family tellurite resistance protein [Aquisalinus sp.]